MKTVRKKLPKKRKGLRNEDLVQEYLNSIQSRCAPSTIASKKSFLEQFIRFLNKPLVKVNSRDIRRFTDSLARRKLGKKTIPLYIDSIRVFNRFLTRYYGYDLPDMSHIRTSDYRRKIPETFKYRPLSREEIRELIEAAKSVRDKLVIAMLYYTGLRTSELTNLKLRDVNPEKGTIKVAGGKGRKDRLVEYPGENLRMLVDLWLRKERNSYLNARRDDHFFVSRFGKGLSPNEIRKIIHKAAKRAGIQEIKGKTAGARPIYKVTPHILRHSFAWHALEDGVKLEHIQRMLGHRQRESSRCSRKFRRRKKRR